MAEPSGAFAPLAMARAYLAPKSNSFWSWSDDGEVLIWPSGRTIVFRDELRAIIDRLTPSGTPPMGALLLLLAACRRLHSFSNHSGSAVPRQAVAPISNYLARQTGTTVPQTTPGFYWRRRLGLGWTSQGGVNALSTMCGTTARKPWGRTMSGNMCRHCAAWPMPGVNWPLTRRSPWPTWCAAGC